MEEEPQKVYEPSLNEILISNGGESTGRLERDIGRKKDAAREGEENNDIAPGIESTIKGEASGCSRRDIHAFLKETMAGSMREVIKDELQAWLGLKTQGHEDVVDIVDNLQEEGDMAEDKEEGLVERDTARKDVSPLKVGDEEEKNQMISPMKEIVEEEEREARSKRDRRTSARQAHQRQSKDYESDTVARATKRKIDLEDKGNPEDIFSIFDAIPIHLILHIAKSCGLELNMGESDLEVLIDLARDRRAGASVS